MAEAKWPVCKEEAKANVRRPWPCADDAADRPLRPGRLPSTSERIAWERAGAQMGRRGPIPFRGLWLCCVGRPSLGGKKGSHPFLGIGLPPRLAPMKGVKRSLVDYLEGSFVDDMRWALWVVAGFSDRTLTQRESEAMGCGWKSLPGLRGGHLWNVSPSRDWAESSPSASKLLSVHPNFIRAERQFDLFVSVKGNVDAVPSRAASAWSEGLSKAHEHAPRSKGW